MSEDGKRLVLGPKVSWFASMGLTVAIFMGIFAFLPASRIFGEILSLDPWLLGVAAVGAIFAEVLPASEKYRRILVLLGTRLGLGEVMLIRMGSLPVRHMMPFKTGEILRMLYLRRRHNVSFVRGGILAFGNMAAEAAALGLTIIIGAAVYMPRWTPIAVAILAALLAAVLIGVPRWSRVLEQYGSRLMWPKAKAAFEEFVGKAQSPGFGPRTLWILAIALVVNWIELVCYGLLFFAAGVDVPLWAMLVIIPAIEFFARAPLTPMGIGTREALAPLLLSSFGQPVEIVAVAIGASIILRVVPAVAGLLWTRRFLDRLIGVTPAMLLRGNLTTLVKEDRDEPL